MYPLREIYRMNNSTVMCRYCANKDSTECGTCIFSDFYNREGKPEYRVNFVEQPKKGD